MWVVTVITMKLVVHHTRLVIKYLSAVLEPWLGLNYHFAIWLEGSAHFFLQLSSLVTSFVSAPHLWSFTEVDSGFSELFIDWLVLGSTGPDETLLSLSLVPEWLDTRNATAETYVFHMSVRGGSWSSDPSCGSCDSPQHFLMGFVSSPGCSYLYCLYTFFYHIFSFLGLSINVLGHRALWTTSL